MKKVYGIDLGTTYSCLSSVDENGKSYVINNSEGQATTPSAVFFESDSSIVVGKSAKEVADVYPTQVVTLVKKFMGHSRDEWETNQFGKSYAAQEVSALILKKLVNDAKQQFNEEVIDVVITCPAYFNATQRQATKQAGEIAGLNVLHVVPEPTAAAISYGIDATEDQTVLVYDLGGGTFDITVIKISKGNITVVTTDGNHKLGGSDWDLRIYNDIMQMCMDEHDMDKEEFEDDEDFLEFHSEVLIKAEEAKVRLSSQEKYQAVFKPPQGGKIKYELTREHFNEITSDLLQNTINLTKQVLETAKDKHGIDSIQRLLLVGGSTFMPQVSERINLEFPNFETIQHDPNQAVAKGAAILGRNQAILDAVIQEVTGNNDESTKKDFEENIENRQEEIKKASEKIASQFAIGGAADIQKAVNTKIQDITPKSFGIETLDRATGNPRVVNLIIKDTQVPCKFSDIFGAAHDGQTGFSLKLYDNESYERVNEMSQCTKLAEAELDVGIPLKEGSPVEIIFQMSADALVTVRGIDKTTGKEATVSYQAEGLLSKEVMEESKSHIGGLVVI